MAKKRKRRRDRESKARERAPRRPRTARAERPAGDRRGGDRRARKRQAARARRDRKRERGRRARKLDRRTEKLDRRAEKLARRAEERAREVARRARRREREVARRARALERELSRRRRAKLARAFGAPVRRVRHRRLRGIAEVRAFLRTNTTPIFVVSPTPFNLLGIDRWVHDLYFVSRYDPFDGAHPRVFAPADRAWREFHSVEEINNALLRDPAVAAFVASKGPGGKVVLIGSDDETERLAGEIGLEVLAPTAGVRARVAARMASGSHAADGAPGASDAVTGTGDAIDAGGRTVIFAAVATRRGTLVGPVLTELVGLAPLTPDDDGRCGTEMWAGALADRERRRARKLVRKLGERLARKGYRGAFEASVVVGPGDDVRVTEVRPRVTGAESMTNASAGAYADVPLFCFHLLEHLAVDYRVDLAGIGARWAEAETADTWSQLVLKDLGERVESVVAAPRSGIWRAAPDGPPCFDRPANDWHGILDESEAFVMRILAPGDFRYRGVDLGTLVARGRMVAEDGSLTERGRSWVEALRARWIGVPVPAAPEAGPDGSPDPGPDPGPDGGPDPGPDAVDGGATRDEEPAAG
jgi:hypothetical protein